MRKQHSLSMFNIKPKPHVNKMVFPLTVACIVHYLSGLLISNSERYTPTVRESKQKQPMLGKSNQEKRRWNPWIWMILGFALNAQTTPFWTWLTHLASRWGGRAVQMVACGGIMLKTVKWWCHRYPLQNKENKRKNQSDSCVEGILDVIFFLNPLGYP